MGCFPNYSAGWWSLVNGTGTVIYALPESPLFNSVLFRILLQLRYQLRDSGWLDSTRAQVLGM
jgi:hypothetical protein